MAEGSKGIMTPEVGPNKFLYGILYVPIQPLAAIRNKNHKKPFSQKRPTGSSRMQENCLAAGAAPRYQLRELTSLPKPLHTVGRGLAVPSRRTPPPVSA